MAVRLAAAALVLASARGAAGLHAAFILPPFSPSGIMTVVAAGLLEAGHDVTLLAWDENVAKYQKMLPGAHSIGTGPLVRPEMPVERMRFMMDLPYELMSFIVGLIITVADPMIGLPQAEASLPVLRDVNPDVLCVTGIIPSHYAVAEALGVPAVGLAFTAPWIFSTSMDMPWSLQPALGSFHNRDEILGSLPLTIWNLAVRLSHSLTRNTIGLAGTNLARWKLGLTRMVFSQHDPMVENPMIVPLLPELAMGYPTMLTSNIVWAGMYDHPMLGGASLGKSGQHDEIMAWLDQHSANNQSVLYASFGSEVLLDLEWAQKMVSAFGSIQVLWVLKKAPPGFEKPPPNVFVTAWSPQKAVLAHPAVTAFLSHGGANSIRESLAAGVPLIILPLFGDQPMNAMMHAEMGVAIKVSKFEFDAERFAGHFLEISTEKYRKRAAEIKALNDKHVNLKRAVEVIENVVSGRFPLRIEQASFAQAWIPILLLLGFLRLALGCCRCGCRCLCRCCRQGGTATGGGKHAKAE